MKITVSRFIKTSLFLCGMGIITLRTQAQVPMAWEGFPRAQKVEYYGIGQYLHSDDITFHGPTGDVKFKMDDTGLGGFGMAYHFNDFFSVHADLMFGGATFRGDVPVKTGGMLNVEQDLFVHTGRFNVDYNIINRRLTPFVTAGIGYQYIETELTNLPQVGYCWWSPWWGYVCDYEHVHAWESNFTWNVGAGFRWNITDHLFIKATGGAQWLEYTNARNVTTQIEGMFVLGWTF